MFGKNRTKTHNNKLVKKKSTKIINFHTIGSNLYKKIYENQSILWYILLRIWIKIDIIFWSNLGLFRPGKIYIVLFVRNTILRGVRIICGSIPMGQLDTTFVTAAKIIAKNGPTSPEQLLRDLSTNVPTDSGYTIFISRKCSEEKSISIGNLQENDFFVRWFGGEEWLNSRVLIKRV